MKECYYAVLDVDRKAPEDVIKKAYRQLALKHHPDKHVAENREEATARFQLIVEAYEVLSNSQERAWYDSHREQILRGGDSEEAAGGLRTKKDIYQYFSSSCYDNRYDDRDGGFYKVYSELFEEISRMEQDDYSLDSSSSDSDTHAGQVYPSFGDSKCEWDDMLRFYSVWGNFATNRYFGSFDKWDIRDGENRQVRRAMDAENKKARAAARKEFSSEIRNLVAFVKRRDKRMAAYLAHQAQVEREAKEAKERQTQEKEEARQRARIIAREEEMKRWEEIEAARVAAGEMSESSASDDEVKEYVCFACRKNFKSEKAFSNHEQSKKHKQEVARLREELLLSGDELETEIQPEVEESRGRSKKSKKKKPPTPSPEVVVPEPEEPESSAEKKERKPRRRRKEKSDPNLFSCQVCSEQFASKSALFRHLHAAGHHAVKLG